MKVRLAEHRDGFALLELARQFYDEFMEAGMFLPFDNEKSAWVIYNAIERALAIVVENDDEKVVGALVLEIQQPYYSKALALWDTSFYVAPEARRSRAAVLLRDAAKAIAADLKLPLYIGVTTADDLDRKEKFFVRAGFKRLGSLYRWGG